jgi:hypothetical protein
MTVSNCETLHLLQKQFPYPLTSGLGYDCHAANIKPFILSDRRHGPHNLRAVERHPDRSLGHAGFNFLRR